MFYITNTPFWLKALFPPNVIWQGDSSGNTVYLSFDDGPTPVVTDFVLRQLADFDARATFFCIGENVKQHPAIVEQVKAAGHALGNHTMTHPNGWKMPAEDYLKEIASTHAIMPTTMFRPPYGRITRQQRKMMAAQFPGMEVIMWGVIAGDFDTSIDGQKSYGYVSRHTKPGSIIVFHDSDKAFPRLKTALPLTLEWLYARGWQSKILPY